MHAAFLLLVISVRASRLALGQALIHTFVVSTLNTCVDPCDEQQQRSLLECATRCAHLDDCYGVSANLENGTCCACLNLGVPEQTNYPNNSMFRVTNFTKDSPCDRDIVDDVPDSHLTASSAYSSVHGPSRARLNTQQVSGYKGAWSASSMDPATEYIQVRFNTVKEIVGVATQGRHAYLPSQYIKSYSVAYSIDCQTFSYIKDSGITSMVFPGNNDRDTIVWNDLPASVLAICVRIQPISFSVHISLRFGIKGCDV